MCSGDSTSSITGHLELTFCTRRIAATLAVVGALLFSAGLAWAATLILCLATPAAADTYAPPFCEFSISPDATQIRRILRDQYGEAEIAEYYSEKSFVKAQCARFLGEPWPEEYLARYLAHAQKQSGVSYHGWSTFGTSAGRAVSLKGSKTLSGELWRVWFLGLSGEKSFLFITIGSKAPDFVPDFAWEALNTLKRT